MMTVGLTAAMGTNVGTTCLRFEVSADLHLAIRAQALAEVFDMNSHWRMIVSSSGQRLTWWIWFGFSCFVTIRKTGLVYGLVKVYGFAVYS